MPTVRTYEAPRENYAYAGAVLDKMRILVARGAQDKTVQHIAEKLKVYSGGMLDIPATLVSDWKYLKNRVPYVADPPDRERIASAKYTVGKGWPGDCDDQSVATATILALQGIPAKFRAIAWRKPEFTHVLTVADSGTPGGEIYFDLTQPILGITYPYHKFFDGDTMPQIETISDGPNTVQGLVDIMTRGTDNAQRREAFATLARMYPREMNYWAAKMKNEAALRGPNFGDYYGDWLSSVIGIVGNVVGSAVGFPVAGTVAQGVVSSATGTPSTSGDKTADPNRPGRSYTDARSYIEELNNVYPAGGKVVQMKINDGANYASLIHVPNIPKLDQHIDTDHPGHLFASWDGVNFWITNLSWVNATPNGNAYGLDFQDEAGTPMKSDYYYQRTIFSDGAERYDNIGTNPGRATEPQTAQAQTDKSTAVRYENGLPAQSSSQIPTQPTSGGASGGGASGSGASGGGSGIPSQVQQAASSLFGGNTPLILGGALALLLLMKK